MIRRPFIARLAVGVAAAAILMQCRPERHWEQDFTRVPLDIPAHATAYVGIELDEPLRAQVELGRHLFYDPLLSADGTVSCASCHLQANGFSDPRALSVGVGGGLGDRNAMALVNLGFDNAFFWDGREHSLSDQAFDPIRHPLEMAESWGNVEQKLRQSETYPKLFFEAFGNLDIDSNQVTQAIAAFETTMLSFDAPFDAFFYDGEMDMLDSAALRGFELFFGDAECVHCHAGPLLTDQTFKSNGLDGAVTDPGLGAISGLDSDLGKFKVPTLRNIAQTAPYMHDGRFATLFEVVEHYNSGVDSLAPNLDPDMHIYASGLNLTVQQKLDLVAFMESFTDEGFLTNPAFSDPR